MKTCETCDYIHSSLECASCYMRGEKCQEYLSIQGGNCHVYQDGCLLEQNHGKIDDSFVNKIILEGKENLPFVTIDYPSPLLFARSAELSKILKGQGMKGFSRLDTFQKHALCRYLYNLNPETFIKNYTNTRNVFSTSKVEIIGTPERY